VIRRIAAALCWGLVLCITAPAFAQALATQATPADLQRLATWRAGE